jgi:hypothetical protein
MPDQTEHMPEHIRPEHPASGWRERALARVGAKERLAGEVERLTAELARIRKTMIDVYGEDYDGDDVAAEVERLLGHLVEYGGDVMRILAAKNNAIGARDTELDRLRAEVGRLTEDLAAERARTAEWRRVHAAHEELHDLAEAAAEKWRARAKRAEAARAAILKIVSGWCVEYNDIGGTDAGDLAWNLQAAGYPLPEEEDEETADEAESAQGGADDQGPGEDPTSPEDDAAGWDPAPGSVWADRNGPFNGDRWVAAVVGGGVRVMLLDGVGTGMVPWSVWRIHGPMQPVTEQDAG